MIDEAQDPAAALRAFGPLLAKALTELGATPAARKSAGRTTSRTPERSGPSRVAQLRAAHMASKARFDRR